MGVQSGSGEIKGFGEGEGELCKPGPSDRNPIRIKPDKGIKGGKKKGGGRTMKTSHFISGHTQ